MSNATKVNGHDLDPQEQEYRVKWEIDVDATSPEEAARLARHMLTRPNTEATIWHATASGTDAPQIVELEEPEEYFFFISTILNWATDEDLEAAIKKARKAHRQDGRQGMFKKKMDARVWRVPGKPSDRFEIKWYAPQVVGAELVTTLKF